MEYTVALLFFLLAFKHTICDLALQKLSWSNKSIYFDPEANKHYFHHGVGSFIVGFVIGWQYAVLISILDYFIHWQIDHLKTRVKNYLGYTDKDYGFWVLQTADQALHFATYYLFVLIAISW